MKSAARPPIDLQVLEPLPTLNANESIQDRLVEFIRASNLTAGDRLPSEGALATRLGVGRPTLREALRSLQSLGFVGVRGGSGWYVKAASLEGLTRHLVLSVDSSEKTLADLLTIREILESAFFDEAVRTLIPEDLERLESLVDEIERRADSDEDGYAVDHDFHRVIFCRVSNEFFHQFMDVCWTLYLSIESRHPNPPRDQIIASARKHRYILEAIRAGDADLARRRNSAPPTEVLAEVEHSRQAGERRP